MRFLAVDYDFVDAYNLQMWKVVLKEEFTSDENEAFL